MLEQYRVRLYEDDNYEVETERRYLVALDLADARGLQLAARELERVRDAVAERRRLNEKQAARVRVSVHDAVTEQYVMDWVGAA